MHRRLFAAAALVALAVPVGADAAPSQDRNPQLSVMTRNIYLGADIARPIGSATKEEFEQKNQIVWDTVARTNFPARAKLLAKEIKKTKPDLIGLQEVSLWRTGPKDNPAPATDVVYDFLRILRKEIKRAGLNYRVGSVQKEANVEGPTVSDGDVRLTMRDVILVKKREGLTITGRKGRNYEARLTVPTAAGPVTVKRGWTYVNAKLNGVRFRFINTHLEAFLAATRLAQTEELIGKNGPTNTDLPMFLVGDMNSDAKGDPDGAGDPAPYRAIVKTGFRDAWTYIKRGTTGFTCCLNQETADDPAPWPGDHRIDHIFTKAGTVRVKGVKAVKVGIDPKNRTKGTPRLWPSDHGGWVATFKLVRPPIVCRSQVGCPTP